MNEFRKKLKKQEGFTLIEMLIVVAIIAILIAISIPVVQKALERSKHATDAANERSAKAEILIEYLSGDGKLKLDTDYPYDAQEGKLVMATTAEADGSFAAGTFSGTYGKHGTHDYIKVKISADGLVTVSWNTGYGTSNSTLCSEKDVSH